MINQSEQVQIANENMSVCDKAVNRQLQIYTSNSVLNNSLEPKTVIFKHSFSGWITHFFID